METKAAILKGTLIIEPLHGFYIYTLDFVLGHKKLSVQSVVIM